MLITWFPISVDIPDNAVLLKSYDDPSRGISADVASSITTVMLGNNFLPLKMIPCINGNIGSISFVSDDNDDYYIRHYSEYVVHI